jgi:hypothetical protein
MQVKTLKDLVLSEVDFQRSAEIISEEEQYTTFIKAVLELSRTPKVSADTNKFLVEVKSATEAQVATGTSHTIIVPIYDAFILNSLECKFTELIVLLIRYLATQKDVIQAFPGFEPDSYDKCVNDIFKDMENTRAYSESIIRAYNVPTWSNHMLNMLFINRNETNRKDKGFLLVLPYLAAFAKHYKIKVNLFLHLKQLYHHTSQVMRRKAS